MTSRPNARQTVLNILIRWTNPADPPLIPTRDDPDAAHPPPTDPWADLGPRDRAFAFDLLSGILRWRGTLDVVIASRLKQPLASLDHPVHAILWLGAYQLLLQGGTTAYAAVDTSVALARGHRQTVKASGLINAVLRGITRLNPRPVPLEPALPLEAQLSRRSFATDFQTRIAFNADIFPEPATRTAHLAAVCSHPAGYVEFLRRTFGDGQAAALLLRNNQRPIITCRADADTLAVPALAGLKAHATAQRFLVAADGWNETLAGLIRAGMLAPQDPTAAAPVRALAQHIAAPPKDVLDLCAGLGTKALQLARTFPSAQITAADSDSVKLGRLNIRASQIGQANIATIPADRVADRQSPIGHGYDVVLVDVPCSNTGVFARRVQSRWRWPTLDHAALHALQLRLLTQGAALLAPGGMLAYATCSIDPAENRGIVEAFLRTHPDFQVVVEQLTLPSLDAQPLAAHDGGYYALLRLP